MKDTRAVLDGVRAKIPADAKLLVVWLHEGVMHCAQANTQMGDIEAIGCSLQANAIRAGQQQRKG